MTTFGNMTTFGYLTTLSLRSTPFWVGVHNLFGLARLEDQHLVQVAPAAIRHSGLGGRDLLEADQIWVEREGVVERDGWREVGREGGRKGRTERDRERERLA